MRLPIRSSLHKPAVLALVLALIAGSALFAVTQNDRSGNLRPAQTVGNFDPVRRAFQNRDEARTALELAMRFLQHPSSFSFDKAKEQVEKTQKAAEEAQAAYAQAKSDEFAAQREAQEHPDNPALKQAYETMKAGADLAKQVADQTLQVSRVASQLLSSAGAAFFPQRGKPDKNSKKGDDGLSGPGKEGSSTGGEGGGAANIRYPDYLYGGSWSSSPGEGGGGTYIGGTERPRTSPGTSEGRRPGGGRQRNGVEQPSQPPVLIPDDGGYLTGADGAALSDPAAILAAVRSDNDKRTARALDPDATRPLTETVNQWKQLVELLQGISDRSCQLWASLEVARQQAEQDLATTPDDQAKKDVAAKVKAEADTAKAHCDQIKQQATTVEIEQAITRRTTASSQPAQPAAATDPTPAPPVGATAGAQPTTTTEATTTTAPAQDTTTTAPAQDTTTTTTAPAGGGEAAQTTQAPATTTAPQPAAPDPDADLAAWSNALVDLDQKRVAAEQARKTAAQHMLDAIAAAKQADQTVTAASNQLADPNATTAAKQQAIDQATAAVTTGQQLMAQAESDALAARSATIAEIQAEDAANAAGGKWVATYKAAKAAAGATTTTAAQPTTTTQGQPAQTTTTTTAPTTTAPTTTAPPAATAPPPAVPQPEQTIPTAPPYNDGGSDSGG